MKTLFFAVLLLVSALSGAASGAAPATCANETGLAARTDVLGCESWESANWWNQSLTPSSRWYIDQGDTGTGFDGRRFYRFPLTSDQTAHTQVVTAGCMVGSCLKVNLPAWNHGGGNFSGNWVIPGVGGCEHSTLGCVPQQEVYLRYYLKLAPNFDPENYSITDGSPQLGGGKFPGLADATNGWSENPSGTFQCGNGGEAPATGTECWSARSGFSVPLYTAGGPQNAFTNTRNYTATTRFAAYPYLYVPGQSSGTRFTFMFADDDYSVAAVANAASATGVCTDTYGFLCGKGDAGLDNSRWYLIEIRVKMNTVGSADGIYQMWIDGLLRYDKQNVVYRTAGHNNLGVRTAWFDIFPGGSGVGMKEDTYVLIDQMAVATSRVGPWEGTYTGSMVAMTPQPNTGEVGFTRNHLLENVLPNGGTCFMSVWGLGIPYGGDNSIWCSNLQQLTGSTVGAWTRLFPNDSSADINTLGIRDNHFSAYMPHVRQFWISGGSYIWPPTKDGTNGGLISGILDLGDCAASFTQDCLKQKIVSRWTAANTTNNWNAAFTNGAGATSGQWFCNFPPCTATVKNLTFGHGGTYTDNAVAWNATLRIGMHGWGYSAYDGNHAVWEQNLDFKTGRSICNTGAATGSEPFISCSLPTNPKNIPVYSNGNDCSDTPTGGGTTPGARLQAMNTLIRGPDRDRAFYLFGTRADNCVNGPTQIRDHWVYNARTKVWTQLAQPPAAAMCDTPLYMYHQARNSGILQCDDKIWEYRMDGGDRWANVTPSGGTGFSTFNSSGVCDHRSEICVVLNGNQTGTAGGAANGLRGFTLSSSVNLATPQIGFAAATSSGSETITTVLIPVVLTNPPAGVVTVDYAVTGGTATGGGIDYALPGGTLTFNGTTTQNIVLNVVNDVTAESNETVTITLSNPTAGVTLGQFTHTYTIADNDAGAPPSPTAFPGRIGAGASIGSTAKIGGL